MSLESEAWWLVPLAIALMCGLVCPMVGTLLILQQRVMGTNVMAFAVLPGMVMGQALGIAPQLGGLISATLTVTLVELWVESRTSERDADAVQNIAMAGCLGVGVLLMQITKTGHALDALLFGDLLNADLGDLLAVTAGLPPMVLLLYTGFNQLAWLGIDPDMAADRELPVRRLRLLLAWLTAWIVTTATAAVGLALVMGLIYSPALLALRQARSLAQAIRRAAFHGALVSGLGYGFAMAINLAPGPVTACCCLLLLWRPRRKHQTLP